MTTTMLMDNINYQPDLEARLQSLLSDHRVLQAQINHRNMALKDTSLLRLTTHVTKITSLNLKVIHRLNAHASTVRTMCWSRDSDHIVSAAHDGHMIVWNSRTKLKEHFEVLDLQDRYAYSCDIGADNSLVACGGLGNNVTVFRTQLSAVQEDPFAMELQVRGPSVVCRFKEHEDCVVGVKFVSNKELVSAGSDRKCLLWDIGRGTRKRAFAETLSDITDLKVSPVDCNVFLTSSSTESEVRLYDIREPINKGVVQIFGPVGDDASALSFFPSGNAFAVGTKESVIALYDIRGGNTKMEEYMLPISGPTSLTLMQCPSPTSVRFKPQEPVNKRRSGVANINVDGIESLSFSSSGRILFVSSPDLGCVAFDVLRGEICMELDKQASAVEVSPDGRAVLAASGSAMDMWSFT